MGWKGDFEGPHIYQDWYKNIKSLLEPPDKQNVPVVLSQ